MQPIRSLRKWFFGDLSPIACFYLPGDWEREERDLWQLAKGKFACDSDAKAWEQHWVQLLRLQQDLLAIHAKDSLTLSELFCISSFDFSVLSFLEDYIILNRDALGCLRPRAGEAVHAEIGAKQRCWEAEQSRGIQLDLTPCRTICMAMSLSSVCLWAALAVLDGCPG